MNLTIFSYYSTKKIFGDNHDIDVNNNVIINGSLDLTEFFNPNYTISIDGNL